MFRAGLETAVRSSDGLELAGVFSPSQLAHDADNRPADVLLIALPQLDEEWIGILSEHAMPVVLLTGSVDASVLTAGLRANIRALLSEDAGTSEIVAAVQAAAAGLIAFQQPVVELLLADQRPAPAALDEPLSRRELEVLAMLAEGLSNKLIAYRLVISEHTVKFHVTSIMTKLRAGSRTEAVMQGIRRGLVML